MEPTQFGEKELAILRREGKRRWKARSENFSEEQRRRSCESARKHRLSLKQKVIQLYGGRCRCCEIDEIHFLTVHHRQGDGAAHRAEIGSEVSSMVYRNILKSDKQDNRYEVLCANCHLAINGNRVCPHKS